MGIVLVTHTPHGHTNISKPPQSKRKMENTQIRKAIMEISYQGINWVEQVNFILKTKVCSSMCVSVVQLARLTKSIAFL